MSVCNCSSSNYLLKTSIYGPGSKTRKQSALLKWSFDDRPGNFILREEEALSVSRSYCVEASQLRCGYLTKTSKQTPYCPSSSPMTLREIRTTPRSPDIVNSFNEVRVCERLSSAVRLQSRSSM